MQIKPLKNGWVLLNCNKNSRSTIIWESWGFGGLFFKDEVNINWTFVWFHVLFQKQVVTLPIIRVILYNIVKPLLQSDRCDQFLYHNKLTWWPRVKGAPPPPPPPFKSPTPPPGVQEVKVQIIIITDSHQWPKNWHTLEATLPNAWL